MMRTTGTLIANVSIIIMFLVLAQLGSGTSVLHAQQQRQTDEQTVYHKLLDSFTSDGVPEDIKRFMVSHLKDDNLPLNIERMRDALTSKVENRRDTLWRTGYIYLWLYRHHGQPDKLRRVYDILPRSTKGYYLATLNMFYGPKLGNDYGDFSKHVLRDVAAWRPPPTAPEGSPARSLYGMPSAAVEFVVETNEPAEAARIIEETIQVRVAGRQQRVDMVLEAMGRLEEHALALARWYFDNYCYRPGEIGLFARFFKNQLGQDRAMQIVNHKIRVLENSIAELKNAFSEQ